MCSEQSGRRYLTPIDDRRWAVQDGSGETLYIGLRQECEDWLDWDEQRQHLEQYPSTSWVQNVRRQIKNILTGLGARRRKPGQAATSTHLSLNRVRQWDKARTSREAAAQHGSVGP